MNVYIEIINNRPSLEGDDFFKKINKMYFSFIESKGFSAFYIFEKYGTNIERTIISSNVSEDLFDSLKKESGIHKMIYNENFYNGKEFVEKSIVSKLLVNVFCNDDSIVLDNKELKIYFYRSGFFYDDNLPSKEKLNSVKIEHMPTGISASYENNRTTEENKKDAIKLLKAKLANHYNKNNIKTNNIIRTYNENSDMVLSI